MENRLFSNKQLIRLVIPLAIEQGLAILVGMADSVMVSSAGEAAISGVSLVDMINAIALNLFAALATGGAVVTSQYLGARNMEKARQSAGQLVLMAALLGLAVMAFCEIFATGMLRLFFGSIAPDVWDAGLLYLRITALSFPFMALYNAGAAIFRSMGNSKVSMKVSVMMNIINVAGNAICILGLKMGVAGVAIPTLVSRAVAAAVILYLASRKDQQLRLQKQNIARIESQMMRSVLHIGVPAACENSFFSLGRAMCVSFVAIYGTVQTSANAVANTIDCVGIIFGQAFSLAMVTVVGQCVGARDIAQIKYYVKKLIGWDYILQGASNVLILILAKQLIGLYSSLSPETEQLAWILIMLHCGFAILMWPPALALPSALRAANDVKFTMWVSVAAMVFARIGLSWLLGVHFGMGVIGVWIGMIMDWVVRIVFFVPRYLSGKWRTKCGLA